MPQPIILATWRFGQIATAAGWTELESGGDALDAVERACRAVEADPQVNSVGIGGLPDFDGRVSLDGCIMLAPDRCGSVCYVQHYAHPVSIARRVMEDSPHVMLAGAGAEQFAAAQGMAPADLLTQEARQRWVEKRDAVRRRGAVGATIGPANREERTGGAAAGDASADEPPHDTVGVLALDARGKLAGACSTSGWPFKLPGRVGDSPIIGHGLYVHPQHGAAVATGHGELVMGTCGTFLAVELMRRGASPDDALREALQRIVESYELTDDEQVGMIALTPRGDWAHACLRDGYRTAVRHGQADELIDAPPLLSAQASD